MCGNKTADEREQMAEEDDRHDDAIVVATPKAASRGAYAYHEPDVDGDPMCNAGPPDTEFVPMTVAEAQKKNMAPCEFCERIR